MTFIKIFIEKQDKNFSFVQKLFYYQNVRNANGKFRFPQRNDCPIHEFAESFEFESVKSFE